MGDLLRQELDDKAIAAEAVREWNRNGNPHLSTGAIGVAEIAARLVRQALASPSDGERERIAPSTHLFENAIRECERRGDCTVYLPLSTARLYLAALSHKGEDGWRDIESAPRNASPNRWLLTDGKIILIGGRSFVCTGQQTDDGFWYTQPGSGWDPAFKFLPICWRPLPDLPVLSLLRESSSVR